MVHFIYELNFDEPDKEKKRYVPSRVSRKQKINYMRMKATRSESKNGNFQFASIVAGEFHVKVDQETPGAIKRKNKNDEEVWELIYNELSGIFLHSMEVTESEYGKQLKVFLRDAEDQSKFFVINAPLSSGYAVSFLSRAAQVDLSKEIEIKIFEIENEDDKGTKFKTKTIVISQEGKKLEKTWDKENSVPKAEPMIDKKGKAIIKNGYAQFDTTAKEDFLEKYVNVDLQPKLIEHLKANNIVSGKPSNQEADADALTGEHAVVDSDADDLPF